MFRIVFLVICLQSKSDD